MMTVQAPTPFGVKNARHLNPEDVARTFVPPEAFWSLLRREHSVVVGPRGSGKTTLMTMLQVQTLRAWAGPEADRARRSLDHIAVMIPTDIVWAEQLKALAASALSDGLAHAFVNCAFVHHSLRAFVDAIEQRLAAGDDLPGLVEIHLTPGSESELAAAFADTWSLPGWHPTLASVKRALGERLRDLGAIVFHSGRSVNAAPPPWLSWDLIDAVGSGIDTFEEVLRCRGQHFSLLLDELELAPTFLVQSLARALRSRDRRVVLKLSLSPYTPHLAEVFTSPAEPHAGHDFTVLRLWYERREQGVQFSLALLASLIRQAGLGGSSADDLFGVSPFDTPPEEWAGRKTAYSPGSRLLKRIESLSAKDPSFASYRAETGLTTERIQRMSGSERAAQLRKIAAIVVVRDAFIRVAAGDDSSHRGSGVLLRSVKVKKIYNGVGALIAALEGNPRWLIGVLGPLLERAREHPGRRLPPEAQARALEDAAVRFRALLSTVPGPRADTSRPDSLLHLLDRISDSLHRRIVADAFSPEPPESFIVDSFASEPFLRAIGMALNSGALIYVAEHDGIGVEALGLLPSLSSLRGKRLRLAYLLGAYAGLPLRLGRAVALSQLIGPEDLRLRDAQQSLPLEESP